LQRRDTDWGGLRAGLHHGLLSRCGYCDWDGVGTAIEARVAYFKTKPIIAIQDSGGTADRIAGTYLDDRNQIKVIGEEDPVKAVMKALDLS